MKNIIITKTKISSVYNLEIVFKLFHYEFIILFIRLGLNYSISFKLIRD